MNTIVLPTARITTIEQRLTEIAQETAQLQRDRELLFLHERDEWRALGIDAHVVLQPHRAPKLSRRSLVNMWETYDDNYGRRPFTREIHYSHIWKGDDPVSNWGPYAANNGNIIWNHKGAYVTTMSDDISAVIVCASKEFPVTATQIRRATVRLRNLARRERFKVSIEDIEATVKTHAGDVVHEGDITTAFLWLNGIAESDIQKWEVYA